MNFIQIFLAGIAEFLVAIFSSIAQGGGNYIIMPLLLIIGATPIAANATLSVSNVGFSLGSIAGLRGIKIKDRLTLAVLMAISTITGLFVPFIIAKMNLHIYSIIIGFMLLVLAPLLYKKPFGVVSFNATRKSKIIGYILLLLLTIIARFTLGIGALFSIVLCKYCGLTVLESNLYRKVTGLFAGITVSIGVILAGFVNWPLTIGLTVASVLGAFVGARISVKKGNKWTSNVMTITMFVSGIILIIINV